MSRDVVAAFDFDGTITRRDTFLPFLQMMAGRGRYLRQMLTLSPGLLAYLLGIINNHAVKNRLLTQFLRGNDVDDVDRMARDFAAARLPHFVRPAALTRLRWHQQQGHRCVIVSASLECYLRPWAEATGGLEVVGSRLASDNGMYTGELLGRNCYGAEKVRRLNDILGARETYTLYAYGDSKGDRELLAWADYAFYRQMPAAT